MSPQPLRLHKKMKGNCNVIMDAVKHLCEFTFVFFPIYIQERDKVVETPLRAIVVFVLMCYCCQGCKAPILPLWTLENGRFTAVYTVNRQELCTTFIILADAYRATAALSLASTHWPAVLTGSAACSFRTTFFSIHCCKETATDVLIRRKCIVEC